MRCFCSFGGISRYQNRTTRERTKYDQCKGPGQIKGENSLKPLSLSGRKLTKLYPNCENSIEKTSKTILECVHNFAPLTTANLNITKMTGFRGKSKTSEQKRQTISLMGASDKWN